MAATAAATARNAQKDWMDRFDSLALDGASPAQRTPPLPRLVGFLNPCGRLPACACLCVVPARTGVPQPLFARAPALPSPSTSQGWPVAAAYTLPTPTIVPTAGLQGHRVRRKHGAQLRVRFENATLVGDSMTCSAAGDKVSLGNNPTAEPCGGTIEDNCVFTCAEEHVLTAAKKALLVKLLLALSRWLGSAFRMRFQLSSPLVVDNSGPPCGFGGRVAIPSGLAADGAANTDVLILVTARPVAGTALAFAGHCQEDAGKSPSDNWPAGEVPRFIPRRPTVGHMNIDPASIPSCSSTVAPRLARRPPSWPRRWSRPTRFSRFCSTRRCMCSDSRLRSFVSCRARRHPHLTVLARQLDGGSRGRAAAAATTA